MPDAGFGSAGERAGTGHVVGMAKIVIQRLPVVLPAATEGVPINLGVFEIRDGLILFQIPKRRIG